MFAATIVLISLLTIYSQQSMSRSTVNHLKKRSIDPLPEYRAFKEGLKYGKLVCQLPLIKGNCTKKFTRFYYDSSTEHCFKFVYTGCKGNGNRFLTKHQCKQRCSPDFWKNHKQTKLSATLISDGNAPMGGLLNVSSSSGQVYLAAASGLEISLQCDEQECNHTTHGKCVNGKCRCYKGFEMRNQKCVDTNECHWVECGPQSTCVNLPGSFRCECRAGYAGSGFNCTTNPAVCEQPFDHRYEKQCNSEVVTENRSNHEEPLTNDPTLWQLRFYYDWSGQKCRQFWYGGCQFGNHQLNFFTDLKVCLDAFDHSRRLPCSASPMAQLNPSLRWAQRFYFDYSTKKCKLFWYDSICQHQPATDPLAKRNTKRRRSRNVFVHLGTCRQACEDPASGEKKKTVGVIQAMFTQVKDMPRHKLVKQPVASDNKTGVGEIEVGVKLLEKEAFNRSLITANIGVEDRWNLDRVRFISDDCLEKFDHNLKKACSRGRLPWSPKYYYDADWKKCRMYWSDGACRTLTRNNFADLATCKWKCESAQPVTSLVDGREQGRVSCLDPFDQAYKDDCSAGWPFTVRYYFDHQNKQCSSFQYGGCSATIGKSPSRNIFVNYEDCLQLCETPTKSMSKACSQPLDKAYRRPCGNHNVFSQYYYYDQKAEACRMFWYGNCKNSKSENIFSTLQSCQWLCEKRKEQKAPAHCLERFDNNYRRACNKGKQWRRKYYFDHKTGQCLPFWYDGCLSKSQNIFPHLSVCRNLCEVPALLSSPANTQLLSSPSTHTHPFNIQASLRCLEAMNRGDCQHELPAYFYNKDTQQCEPFSYSGCSGNGNRFLTIGQCRNTCEQFSQLNSAQANCLMALNVGFGRQNMTCIRNAGYRFYYNPQYGKCGRFWYFGCGGNENMFPNYAACDRLCQGTIQQLDNSNVVRSQRSVVSVEACFMPPKKDDNQTTVCSLEEEVSHNSSNSTSSLTKWTYSTSKKSCQPIEKSACITDSAIAGSSFDSLQQCTSTCSGLKVPNSLECAHLPDWGPCNLLRYMWFYNLTKGSCDQFLWGGCGGNSNRFPSFELCQITCEPPSDDLCSDRLDRGEWCESMTNRFYFHSDSKTCKGFHYTGCGKSRNNFKSLESCEQRCIHRKDGAQESDGLGLKEMKSAEIATVFFNGTEQKTLKYSGSKPPEKPAMERHQILVETSLFRPPLGNDSFNNYVKAEGQYIDYGYCTGYRYNISGTFTRLTSYMCLMEEGGTCQVHTLWDTGGDEQCKVVRPWLRGTHYYTWFFIVDRRPYWRRPDGPPIRSRGLEEADPKANPRQTTSSYVEKMMPPPIKDSEETISSIIILPINDCHSIC